MTKIIRIYVEGGGDKDSDSKANLRKGFDVFFSEIRDLAHNKGISLRFIPCGSRSSTYDNFRRSCKDAGNEVNILLVDAEEPVSAPTRWEHLKNRREDQWKNPGAEEKHCHLMVQTMEAWFLADREKLREYFGQGFNENALPKNANVEEIDKKALLESLNNAVRNTKKKKYHKTRHAPDILKKIRLKEVASKAMYCKSFYQTLLEEIDAA